MDRLVGDLGLRQTGRGHVLRVWSRHATSMELRIFDAHDLDRVTHRIPMRRGDDDVWSAESDLLQPGTAYAVGVDGPSGPTHRFDATRHALPRTRRASSARRPASTARPSSTRRSTGGTRDGPRPRSTRP
nr:hypothetical protein [Agrococcus sp. SGAir0287]